MYELIISYHETPEGQLVSPIEENRKSTSSCLRNFDVVFGRKSVTALVSQSYNKSGKLTTVALMED